MTFVHGAHLSPEGLRLLMAEDEFSYSEAYAEAIAYAYELGDDVVVRDDGKKPQRLHDHDDWDECTSCPAEPTWCFTLFPGTN